MFKSFKKLSPKNSAAREVTNLTTRKVYTISGVRRLVAVPNVHDKDGKPFNMEFDIAIFEGSFKLEPTLGFSLPLCKFIVAKGTNLNLQEFTDRLGEALTCNKKFSNTSLVKAITSPGLKNWSTTYNDMYHDLRPLTVNYIS